MKIYKILIFLIIPLFGFILFSSSPAKSAYTCSTYDPTYSWYQTLETCQYLNGNPVGCSNPSTHEEVNVSSRHCNVRSGYSSCGGTSSRCGTTQQKKRNCHLSRDEDNRITRCYYTYESTFVSDGCRCNGSAVCKHTSVNCSGKCGRWSISCGDTKSCGGCATGYDCNNGYCKKKPVNDPCKPYTCDANLPIAGRDCDLHTNGSCSGTKDCGGCPAGYSCKGKTGGGLNGNCKKNPEPADPTYSVTVLVFYDKYGSGAKKGSEGTYNLCYPATGTGGAGNASGNVTVVINGKSYTKTMYKNCRRDGKLSTPQRGFVISGLKKKCNDVKLVTPGGAAYDVTGYNYSNGGGTKVVTSGTQPELRHTPNICGDAIVRFGVEKVTKPQPPEQVAGFVFIDNNENGRYEPEDNDETVCYSKTVGIKVGNTNKSFLSKKNCTPFSYDITGTQNVSLNPVPAGFAATGLEYIDTTHPLTADDEYNLGPVGASSINLNGESEVHFGIKPVDSTFTISGNIFVDTLTEFKKKQPAESNFKTGSAAERTITITDASGAVVSVVQPTSGAGYTTTQDLNAGEYTVTYTGGPPAGYEMNYPVPASGVQPSFIVTLGDACDVGSHNAAVCDANGNITNLDFGISTIGGNPWYQTVGGDLRNDSSNSNKIPASGSCSYTSQYASAGTAKYDPGLVFNSSSSLDLGATGSQNARASTKRYLVTGKKFKTARGGSIRTAHSYLTSIATRGGQTPKSLYSGGNNENPPCTGSKPTCVLTPTSTSTFTSGVYTSNGGLTIPAAGTAYNFANNKKIVFLVTGDIRIERNITVAAGSSVAFIATGNIIIGSNVTNVAGIFSANKNFIVEDSAGNSPLNINGSVVANAANLSGALAGKFDNQRSNLAGADGDGVCPSVRITANPAMLLNAPPALKVPNYSIAEVAPGPISSSTQGTLPTVTPTPSPLPPTSTPTPVPTNTPTPSPTPATVLATGYAFTDGDVTIDAEVGSPLATRFTRSSHSWDTRTSPLGYTGTGYIAALADSGANISSSISSTAPEVRYNLCFPASGRYYIWTRGSAPDAAGDAIAYGLDGSVQSTANPTALYIKDVDGSSDWQWRSKLSDGSRSYIEVPSAGFHNFNLYMRNDGARIDKIALVTGSANPSYAGTSNSGPTASGTTTCVDNR